jgi:indolepyruvate ferredoxin oxidoreductase
VQIASIPDEIRGFGHVKRRNLEAAQAKEAELLRELTHAVERHQPIGV